LKIVSIQAFHGASIFAPVPIVRLVVDFGDQSNRSPASLPPEFAQNVLRLVPELEVANQYDAQETASFGTALFHDESLRLGHVVAGVALALQRIAGAEVAYAAVQVGSGHNAGHQEILYAHLDNEVGIMVGRAATSAVAHLASASLQENGAARPAWKPEDYRQKLLGSILARSLDMSTAALVREAVQRDIPWRRLNPRTQIVQFGHGRLQKRIRETVTSSTSGIGILLSKDKDVSNRLLAEVGVPVPTQAVISVQDKVDDEAQMAVNIANNLGYPVVVKPADGGKGLGVGVNLGTAAAVSNAVIEASKHSRFVIIESYIAGDDHRILVVGGKMIAAARRIPGHVVGNGRDSITKLVDAVNRDPRRGKGYEKLMAVLALDTQAERVLSGQGLSPHSVPAADAVVYLRYTANISTGGTAIDVTDSVHPDNARAAVRAALTLGLDVAGVDFISPDIGRSYRENGGAICEINASPGLRPHWLGDAGRDVVGPIMDTLYPPGARSRVPIAAITGTHGKTTTTRMVARILEQGGGVVGFASTDGAYIDRELIVEADVAGLTGARLVLQCPEIDAAVLETARRGIITRGLEFDWCDVGAVLNVGDDHIGTDGIRDIEDLARVKGLVAQATRGTVVLNADDNHCLAMVARSSAQRVCYVTVEAGQQLVAGHIAAGGMAVTLRPGAGGPVIELHEDGEVLDILRAWDVPIAMNGKAMHNVQNAMFAAAIARSLGTSLPHIRSGLRALSCDREDTPGRLDIFDRLPFKVVLDYAHNPEEFEAATTFIKQLGCQRRQRRPARSRPSGGAGTTARRFVGAGSSASKDQRRPAGSGCRRKRAHHGQARRHSGYALYRSQQGMGCAERSGGVSLVHARAGDDVFLPGQIIEIRI
jgi:cyanophycin synthetase